MLEETLQKLSAKQSLDGDDAVTLLQLLQDYTAPIFSMRSVGSSPATSCGRHPTSRPTKKKTGGRGSSYVENRVSIGGGVERRACGKVLNAPELNTPHALSPKRASFETSAVEPSISAGDGAAYYKPSAPDVNSLQDFPPMQQAAAISTRKKDKRASKPRRITLTSIQHQQQHHHHSHTSHSAHFTPPPPPTSDSWSPISVVEVSAPSPLSEERRLLRRERSKRTQGRSGDDFDNLMTGASPRKSSTTPPNTDRCPLTSSSSTSHQLEEDSAHSELSAEMVCTVLTSTPVPATGSQCAVSVERVTNRETLDRLAQLYPRMITDRLVPNIISEMHFVVQLLTCTQPASRMQGSGSVLDTIENCVYFAVRVLYDIRSLLTALDRATLQLLCENIRIKQFEPRLAVFLSGALETAQSEASSGRRSIPSQSAFARVPFQQETDNIKNFPNMKVFHAFKKQRDSFYSILREWEEHRNTPNWNFQSALRDKIRLLMSQPPELCSLDHLATLFQKQLLESCGYVAVMSGSVRELVDGPLKNLTQDKLMRLSERFQRQSHASTGACPQPAFSEIEHFFSTFITTADSYVFNHYLSSVLRCELLKLHSRCESVTVRDVPETLHALRVLAKFLGYLDFLPYSTVMSPSLLPARTASPHVAMVSECVRQATERGHLSLTIPWVVDYMSMMDSRALQVAQLHTLLCQLISVYRFAVVEGESVTVDTFLVLTCLGWLFEIPNVPNSIFFESLKDTYPETNPSLTDTQSELVSRELLYLCCPHLAGIRVVLAEFAAGLQSKTSPIRKIKPIPAGPSMPRAHSTPSSQLQTTLRDNFFRSHPPVVKQVCDTVSERVAETAVQLVQNQVILEHIRRGLQVLAAWIATACSAEQLSGDSGVNIEELFKNEAVQSVVQVSEQTYTSVLKEATHFCKQHIETHTQKAISSLLYGTISQQVMTVAVSLSTDSAVDHCMKWMHSKLRGVVFQEVSSRFDRLRKAVRAAGSRVHCSPYSSSSLNTVPSSSQSGLESSCPPPNSTLRSLRDTLSSQCLSVSDGVDTSDMSHGGPSNPTIEFVELASLALSEKDKSLSRDEVERLTAATTGVREFILSQVVVVEGGYSPLLLPAGVDKLLSTSVQLAALLVAHDAVGCHGCGNEIPSFVVQTTSLWSLLKGLKQEIPIHILLSADSVTHYLEKGTDDVWHSLTVLFLESIKHSIVTTDVVEALWLCRIKQSPANQRRSVINGGGIFMDTWYKLDQGQQEAGVVETELFREVCFVRLLRAVVSESDIPPSITRLKNHPSLPLLSL